MKLKLVILPLCLIVLNAFGFEGTIRQTVKNYNGTGTDVTMTWYLGAHGCRIDMSTSGKDAKPGTTVLLMDPSAKTIRTYEAGASQKLYLQFPSSAITGDAANETVTKTSESKQIQGYKCEKWTVTKGDATYDVWITRDIDFDAVLYKDFFKGSIEIQALALQGVKGFPILTESSAGVNAASADNISTHSISAETLSVPSDYTLFPEQKSVTNKK